jgi:hypothetical protein
MKMSFKDAGLKRNFPEVAMLLPGLGEPVLPRNEFGWIAARDTPFRIVKD